MPQHTDLDAVLDSAIADHRAGRPGLAEAGYRRVLEVEPDHADALNLLGLVLQDQGNHREAIRLICLALDIDPDFPEALTNLARAKRAVGDPDAAVALATKALTIDPDLAEAHLHRGRALLDLARNQDALPSLRRATELDPGLADAWIGLGNVHLRLNNVSAAADVYKIALDRAPASVEVRVNLGACLLRQGKPEEALIYQRQAAEAAPGDPAPHAAIGATLRQMGDISGSMDACLRAVALAPRYHDPLVLLGNNNAMLGQFDEAAALYRRALAVVPESGAARAGLAAIGQEQADRPTLERLSVRLHDPAASDFDRSFAGFALGSVLDRAGRYDEAFQAYATANELVRESRRPARHAAELKALKHHVAWVKRIVTPELFAATRDRGDPSERPVFIVGMPRSGTTLVEQIAASHPLVFGAGELRDVPTLLRTLDGGAPHVSPLNWDRDRMASVARAHVAALADRDAASVRTIDKLPDNVQLLGQIAVLFPNARIVICRRDLRDVCLSCYFQHFGDGNDWSFDLATCAIRARLIEELTAYWRSVLPLPILDIEYEALVADLEGQSRRLIGFLGLEWDAACLDFHKTTRPVMTASQWQVRQPLFTGSVGRWRHYRSHLGPMLAGLQGLVAEDPAGWAAMAENAAAFSDLARAHLVAGAPDDAAAAARHAVNLAPDQAGARGVLGLCLLELGQAVDAVPHLQEAIRLAPDWLNPRIDLAAALTRMKQFAAAADAWRQVLAVQPDNVSHLAALASVLRELGQRHEALEPLRRLAALQPDSARAHADLAIGCLAAHDPEAAETALRQALRLAPNAPEYVFSLGEVLAMLGRFPESAGCFKQAAEHPSYTAWAHAGLASIGEIPTARADLSQLRSLLADRDKDRSERAAAGFALAKALDQAGCFDAAFETCALANRLTRERHLEQGMAFDAAGLRQYVSATIAKSTPAAITSLATFGDPSELPVFIVGMPRSGTSLVEQIAASHPAVFGGGESKIIRTLVSDLDAGAARQGRERWLPTAIRTQAANHIEALREAGGAAIRVTNKMPDNIQYLWQIAVLFPGARVILCRRDLRDVGLSCFMASFTDGMEWAFDLADIGARAREIERLAGHWRGTLPLPLLEVQYEDLVADLEGQSRRLIRFLGLEWDPACLSFHTTERPIMTASHWQVRQPLYDSSVGRWRKYQKHLGPLFAALDGVVDPGA